MTDVRYAWRVATKNPGTTLAALLALTLGIGITTAMFSVVNGVIVRPLPIVDPDRAIEVFESVRGNARFYVSMADCLEWKKRLKSIESYALYNDSQANFTGSGTPERVRTLLVEHTLLPMVGVQPARGRNFTMEENQPGKQYEAILSWPFWTAHFGGDDAALGKKIVLDDKTYTIVGVLPKDFLLFGNRDIWLPVSFDPNYFTNKHGANWYMCLGKLRQGQTLAAANAELAAAAALLAREFPKENHGMGAGAVTLRDWISGDVRPALLILLGAVSCVMLIACGNVANLLLARASGRRREISVRIALGASPWQIYRQLTTESLLLSASAAIAGLGIAAVGVHLVRTSRFTHIPHPEQIVMDWRVLLFSMLSAVVTGLLFGSAPAFQVSISRIGDALKQASGKSTDSRASQQLRRILLCAETAIAGLLMIGSGLLLQSFMRVTRTDLGFDPEHVLTMNVSLPLTRYRPDGKVGRFVERSIERIQAIPGVKSAAFTSNLPLLTLGAIVTVQFEGKEQATSVWAAPVTQLTSVSPGYFRTMKIPLLAGRDFNEHDTTKSPGVLIVSKEFARQYFPNSNPLGERLAYYTDPGVWREIVGVVGDVRQDGIEQRIQPELFGPATQLGQPWTSLVVRTDGDPLHYAAAIREKVQEIDPLLPLFSSQSMNQVMNYVLGWRTFSTSLLLGFTLIAMVLACIGIYAVVAYSVTQRRAEIGLRMALGADREHILWLVARQGIAPAAVGAVLGAGLALVFARALSGMLYGVGATDFLTYLVVVVCLILVAGAASLVPAARAAAVDPSRTLRYE